jgi:hypothetical protein
MCMLSDMIIFRHDKNVYKILVIITSTKKENGDYSARMSGRSRMLAYFPAPCFPRLLVSRAHVGPLGPDVSRTTRPHMRTVCPLGGAQQLQ